MPPPVSVAVAEWPWPAKCSNTSAPMPAILRLPNLHRKIPLSSPTPHDQVPPVSSHTVTVPYPSSIRSTSWRVSIAVLALGLFAGACGSGNGESASGDAASAGTPLEAGQFAPNATVDRVVDGDTIIVFIDGRRERVRLIGIDTPESVDPNRPEQCYGHEASVYLESMLPSKTPVSLVRDVEARDKYDRLLAYVIRTEDQLFINLDLIEKGYAGPLTFAPNDHYADLFESSARAAASAGIGLWSACGGPDVPLG